MSTEREEMLAAADAFEFIRLKLIGYLEEPQRSAFWKAVEMRDRFRLAAAPPAGSPELSMLLRLADHIVAHGRSITYPSIGAAQEVRNVVRQLAEALRRGIAPAAGSAAHPIVEAIIRMAVSDGEYIGRHGNSMTAQAVIDLREGATAERLKAARAALSAPSETGRERAEPVAWRYKCQDGSKVVLLKRLTDEQKSYGYYYGGGEEQSRGPFHWAEETPLYTAQPETASNVREGWKLVPIVADDAMRDAAVIGSRANISYADFDALWPEVIAVAPSPPAESPDDQGEDWGERK